MDTLIELYDDRAIENVLGVETFKPKRVVYVAPADIATDRRHLDVLNRFFTRRGLSLEIEFVGCSVYKADRVLEQLEKIHSKYPDCAVDITGGSDAALFAAGMFCNKTGIPSFTYSRKNNKFYNISNADFADEVSCTLNYSVEEFFNMTGGTMRKGRVDNRQIMKFSEGFVPLFQVFLKHRRQWNDAIVFFQRISQAPHDTPAPLSVVGSVEQKADHGRRVAANKELLSDLEKIGYLSNIEFHDNDTVSFRFASEEIRGWLRDVGSALELYMYKACIDAGIFGNVISSAIVDWDGTVGRDSVSNEIDVVAARGITPVFISCKACEVKTEALNELAILRDRFGGKGAKAIIATTEFCNAAARHRAAQLGIAVIDLEELENGMASDRIKIIMKVKK